MTGVSDRDIREMVLIALSTIEGNAKHSLGVAQRELDRSGLSNAPWAPFIVNNSNDIRDSAVLISRAIQQCWKPT